eukprot:4778010-Alexandrium_andersonii.AAC.1
MVRKHMLRAIPHGSESHRLRVSARAAHPHAWLQTSPAALVWGARARHPLNCRPRHAERCVSGHRHRRPNTCYPDINA